MAPFVPYDPSAKKPYFSIDPNDVARVEIFPPIGIARVGNSGSGQPDCGTEVQYYYGPEVPGITDHPFGDFREDLGEGRKGGIKRQAVRFRVYAYNAAGTNLGEINNSNGYQLEWKVHVANKKAAFYLSRGMHQEQTTDLRNPDTDPIFHTLEEGLNWKQAPLRKAISNKLEIRTKLIVDPKEQSITRNLQTGQSTPVPLVGSFQGSLPKPSDAIPVTLGELRTDDCGRLVFIGGTGLARSVQDTSNLHHPEIISEFDSIDWIDDICDGWVDVAVSNPKKLGMRIAQPQKATVLSAPPKFAWGIDSPTSLYDVMEDFYKKKLKYVDHEGTDFYKDIWPVLEGTYKLAWVNEKAFQGHGPGGYGNFFPKEAGLASADAQHLANREFIFGRLRAPNFANDDEAHIKFMPRLSGDNGDAIEPGSIRRVSGKPIQRFAALTQLQHDRFRSWKDGKFEVGRPYDCKDKDFMVGEPYSKKTCVEDFLPDEQTVALARAMLEQTIGDPLYPGIETYWIAKLPEIYRYVHVPQGLRPPFRIDHEKVLPGFLTRGLSLPWQSDFSLCNTHWWPSARPDDVAILQNGQSGPSESIPRVRWTTGLRDTPEDVSAAFFPGSTDMIRTWHQLGFVAKVPGAEVVVKAQDGEAQILPVYAERERVLAR